MRNLGGEDLLSGAFVAPDGLEGRSGWPEGFPDAVASSVGHGVSVVPIAGALGEETGDPAASVVGTGSTLRVFEGFSPGARGRG